MGELGDRLREAREYLGLTLDQVEEGTRIRRVFLQALEDERFDQLPGNAYARGFVRNYASYLGLDAEDAVRAYRAATGTSAKVVPEVLDEPLLPPNRANMWAAVFLSAMVIAVVGLGVWYGYNRVILGQDPLAALRGPTLTHTVEPRPSTLPSGTATLRASTSSQATLTQPIALATATRTIVRPTHTPVPTIAPTSTPTLIPEPSPTPVSIRVEAELVSATYVAVDVDGVRVLEKILAPDEDQVWIGQRSVSMRIGNAAGILLEVNGVSIPPLGGQGEVLDVTYTIDNLPQG